MVTLPDLVAVRVSTGLLFQLTGTWLISAGTKSNVGAPVLICIRHQANSIKSTFVSDDIESAARQWVL